MSDTTYAPTIVLVDPTSLLVDTNVRHEARLDAEFLASITEHGVAGSRWSRSAPATASCACGTATAAPWRPRRPG